MRYGKTMSRIGQRPISVPENIQVKITKDKVKIVGLKGELEVPVYFRLKVQHENTSLLVERESEDKKTRSMHGLTRTLIHNAIRGVTSGFTKHLEMVGVGYRAKLEGNALILNVGYSHPLKIEAPEGIMFNVAKNTRISVSGIDKQQVGAVAAQIKKTRPPDPYKGKGIRYKGEIVRKKPGKAAKTVGIGE